MFGLFKKGSNNGRGSTKPVSPEGEKISKPISPNVQGRLRHALELLAYVLEHDESKNQHIIAFIATADDESGRDGVNAMDAAFVRGSDESVGDMLMQVGMKDDTFAKAMIAVAQAIQYHKPELKKYAKNLMEKVQQGIDDGEISPKSGFKRGEKRSLDNFGEEMKRVSLDDLSKASDEEIDNMIEDLLKSTREDEEDED
jgi:hypothetical protein